MSATHFQAVAVAIKTAIDNAGIAVNGTSLKVYSEGKPIEALDSLPCVTIMGPVGFQRPDPDEPESQLGSADWKSSWQVDVFTKHHRTEASQQVARAVLGQVIAAVDADYTLGGVTLLGAAITGGDLVDLEEGEAGQFIRYRTDLDVWALISTA